MKTEVVILMKCNNRLKEKENNPEDINNKAWLGDKNWTAYLPAELMRIKICLAGVWHICRWHILLSNGKDWKLTCDDVICLKLDDDACYIAKPMIFPLHIYFFASFQSIWWFDTCDEYMKIWFVSFLSRPYFYTENRHWLLSID